MSESRRVQDAQVWFERNQMLCGIFIPEAEESVEVALAAAPSMLADERTDTPAWQTAFALGAELYFWRQAFEGRPVPRTLRGPYGMQWVRDSEGHLTPLMQPDPSDCEIDTPVRLYAWLKGYAFAVAASSEYAATHEDERDERDANSAGPDADADADADVGDGDGGPSKSRHASGWALPLMTLLGLGFAVLVGTFLSANPLVENRQGPPPVETPGLSHAGTAITPPDGDTLSAAVAGASGAHLTVRSSEFLPDAGMNLVVIDDTREGARPLIGWSPVDQPDVLMFGRVLRLSENRDLTAEAALRYLHTDNRLLALIDTPVVEASTSTDDAVAGPVAAGITTTQTPKSVSEHDAGAVSLSSTLSWLDGAPGSWVAWDGLVGNKRLYVGVDPDCIHCHRYLGWVANNLDAFREAGVVPTVVPMGFLTTASLGKAAAMLDGGMGALARNEAGFTPSRGGGLEPITQDQAPVAMERVQANTVRLFRMAETEGQSPGTPMLMWRAGNARDYLLIGDPGAEGMALILASFADGWTDGGDHSANQ